MESSPNQSWPQSLNPPVVSNVVATADFKQKLNLKKIATACRNAEYNPARFPAVVIRIREPKATALIFAKGKMVITGARSEQFAMQAAKMFEKIVLKVTSLETTSEQKKTIKTPKKQVRFAKKVTDNVQVKEGLADFTI